jgi:zinc D-Ala-D-Ala carboxypeptidase
MRLSEHFELWEFTKSETAKEKGIKNIPGEDHINNLKKLCLNVLEPAREKFGVIDISSGFRNPELNREVGGEKTSQHQYGEAADIVPRDYNLWDAFEWMQDNLVFDQIIYEKRKSGNWIHVSFSEGENRGEIKEAVFIPGRKKPKYNLLGKKEFK